MKKSVFVFAMALIFGMVFVIPGIAGDQMDHSKMDHSKMDHSKMDHSGHAGMLIHESTVDGNTFAYHLIDMKAKMEGMKNMPEMTATHHLMVYVEDSHGHKIVKGKVGFLVEGPEDAKQKVMAMGMSGGFGADLDLGAKGKYTIKTKIAAGKKKLMDKFVYEVK